MGVLEIRTFRIYCDGSLPCSGMTEVSTDRWVWSRSVDRVVLVGDLPKGWESRPDEHDAARYLYFCPECSGAEQ